MGRHITDRPRTRDDRSRLERYPKIASNENGRPGRQSKKVMRESRTRRAAERLKRFLRLDRRGT